MKFCSKCGKEIEDDAKFCPNCGSKQGSNDDADAHIEEVKATFNNSNNSNNSNDSEKIRLVAGLLNILLPFGIGRFYTGHNSLAIAQLLVTLLTCGFGFIWSFIDGIIMLLDDHLTDSDGRHMKMN
ncbi:MAG: TM2 domain-containing protein [Acholeplasmatales bacterium]|nr:TM2 domain-containing protein [Acholeplasmatales bacterium]